MKARPILFSGAMVRALLGGTKTQTRRIVKGVPSWDHFGRDIMDWGLSGIHQAEDDLVGTDQWALDVQTDVDAHSRQIIRCPYGSPGDLLWAKERLARSPDLWTYVADGAEVGWPARGVLAGKRLDYAPSIHMPKVASRLTLRITDVRVERLLECSDDDARSEGLQWVAPGMYSVAGDLPIIGSDPRQVYFDLWDHINGAGSAAANPWVWAVSFEVLRQNVETALQPNAAAPAAHSPVIDGENSRAEPPNSYPSGRDQ